MLAAECIGYLVPPADFDGEVHSVFARACNLACADSLLTLVAPGLGDGPTTLRLGCGAPVDLRALFRPGDRLRCHAGLARSRRVALRLADATVWRPAALGPMLPAPQIASNLQSTVATLAEHRHAHSSVIDRNGARLLAGLGQACRELDVERACSHVGGLVGWGEGLTPAGDDVLVGWYAALNALAGDHGDRRNFLRDLSIAIVAQTQRTTPIAAHYLRLATEGHFNADVTRLRNALLCERDPAAVKSALDTALAVGATSGADLVTGFVSGCVAWSGDREQSEGT